MAAHALQIDELETYRPLLRGFCYRMLAHPQDAEDAVQDTFTRAIRSRDTFRGDASVKNWLVRIATNVCLDQIKGRRKWSPLEGPAGSASSEITMRPSTEWIAPIPDEWVQEPDTPHDKAVLRQSLHLAVIAAMQNLPPKQRAALVLADVLEWNAADAADAVGLPLAAYNSALQRARKNVDLGIDAAPTPPEKEDETIARYVDAFQRFNVPEIISMLSEDIVFSMPPIELWLSGPSDVEAFLRGPGSGCAGSVLRPAPANGMPAFAHYKDGGAAPWGLVVLETKSDRISGIHTFLSVDELFPLFSQPLGEK